MRRFGQVCEGEVVDTALFCTIGISILFGAFVASDEQIPPPIAFAAS